MIAAIAPRAPRVDGELASLGDQPQRVGERQDAGGDERGELTERMRPRRSRGRRCLRQRHHAARLAAVGDAAPIFCVTDSTIASKSAMLVASTAGCATLVSFRRSAGPAKQTSESCQPSTRSASRRSRARRRRSRRRRGPCRRPASLARENESQSGHEMTSVTAASRASRVRATLFVTVCRAVNTRAYVQRERARKRRAHEHGDRDRRVTRGRSARISRAADDGRRATRPRRAADALPSCRVEGAAGRAGAAAPRGGADRARRALAPEIEAPESILNELVALHDREYRARVGAALRRSSTARSRGPSPRRCAISTRCASR